ADRWRQMCQYGRDAHTCGRPVLPPKEMYALASGFGPPTSIGRGLIERAGVSLDAVGHHGEWTPHPGTRDNLDVEGAQRHGYLGVGFEGKTPLVLRTKLANQVTSDP